MFLFIAVYQCEFCHDYLHADDPSVVFLPLLVAPPKSDHRPPEHHNYRHACPECAALHPELTPVADPRRPSQDEITKMRAGIDPKAFKAEHMASPTITKDTPIEVGE